MPEWLTIDLIGKGVAVVFVVVPTLIAAYQSAKAKKFGNMALELKDGYDKVQKALGVSTDYIKHDLETTEDISVLAAKKDQLIKAQEHLGVRDEVRKVLDKVNTGGPRIDFEVKNTGFNADETSLGVNFGWDFGRKDRG